MKKLTLIFISIMLIFTLAACSKTEEAADVSNRPPAFSVLQKQQKHTKHSEKGESATFSKTEFSDFLGDDLTYITVTSLPEAEKGTLVFNGSSVILNQNLPAEQLEYLKFVPTAETSEATFNFTCDAKSYNGSEMTCEIVFTDGINAPPIASDGELTTVEGISCGGKLKISDPNGDDYTINVITYPSDGFINVSSDGSIIYIPEDGFSGNDSMVYSVTDRFGAVSETATLSISVDENESGIYFADMQDDLNHYYAQKLCDSDVMIYRCEDGKYYFEPTSEVSKMEFLVMMMNVSELDADITAVADSVASDDSGLSSGLKGYISAAADIGILKLENGKFSPYDPITYSDAAYMVAEALGLPETVVSSPDSEESAFHLLAALVSAGIIEPDEGSIDPTAFLTKSDCAALLYRIENYMIANNMKTID